jgi:hypothetical protein
VSAHDEFHCNANAIIKIQSGLKEKACLKNLIGSCPRVNISFANQVFLKEGLIKSEF